MRRFSLLFLISFISTNLLGQDAKTIYNKTVGSTVTIETDRGLGSGFFVGQNIIATNFHVIEGATIAYCSPSNFDTAYKIEGYLAVDTSIDLILLKVSGFTKPALKIALTKVTTGQKIFAIGSPKGLPATISDGLVSSLRNFQGKQFIQITAPISSGSSGGPILNTNSELVGISVGQFTGGQNLNFAIPAKYLQALLNTKKRKAEPLTKLPIRTTSLSRSQTETQDWIKEKIENFTHNFNEPGVGDYGTEKYEVEFNDCKLIIKWKYDATHSHVFTGELSKLYIHITYEIPSQYLSRLYFINDNTKKSEMVLKIKSNESIIKEIIESDYGGYKLETKNINMATLYIPHNLLQDNLPDRLTKAFDNLIEACGGKVTKEVF